MTVTIQGRQIDWSTMGDLVEAQAAKHGSKNFAEVAGERLSYADLDRLSRNLACNLIGLGISKGDRVASLMHNRVEQVLMCFGVARAGAVWVPINSALRGADLTHTLTDSGARILVLEDETRPQFDQLDAKTRDQVRVFVAGEAGPYEHVSSLLADAEASLPDCDPSDVGAILYTGGTTGLPKGVLLSQFSFILGGLRYREAFATCPGERHFTVLPLYHAGCLHWGLTGPFVSDMSTVIDRRFSASAYFDRVRETGANVIDPFGAVVTLICRQPPNELDTKHAVRVSAGVNYNLPPGTAEEFQRRFNIPMIGVYGLTEAGGNITSNRLADFDTRLERQGLRLGRDDDRGR
jgi:crotonobetaine/carnitine-CoA ligase